MNKENKLGRGLSALLSSKTEESTNTKEYKIINISSILVNKNQPRKRFDKNILNELAESIKKQGVLQPIVVRRTKNSEFEIVAGERRWRAAQIAGLHEMPAIIKTFSDDQAMEIALIENIQRENLNPVEEARAFKFLSEKNNNNHEEIANLVSKSQSHISNMIRLLELDEEILELIEDKKLSMGHARALIGVPNSIDLAKEIINKKLSVREIEKKTAIYKKSKSKTNKSLKDPNIIDLERELSEKIGLKTSINFNEQGSSGSITVYYSNLDQLDEVMRRLKK